MKLFLKKYVIFIFLSAFFISCSNYTSVSPLNENSRKSIEHSKKQDAINDTLLNNVLIQDSVEIGVFKLKKNIISIIGVGDIMMGTNYPNTDYLPPNQGKNMLNNVSHILKNADVTFGNLEGVILNSGGKPKYCKNPKICYLFRSPEYLTNNLTKAGFDVVSIANNHTGDFGKEGRESTYRILKEKKIYFAGTPNQPFDIFTIDNIKFGFAAFAPNKGTMNINEYKIAGEIINHLDSLTDIVIVSFHGGAEGSKYDRVTRKNEIFYGENRGNVYEFSHKMIDLGADIVFGHGPHVTRAMEIYKNRFIAYSLGNFCTYARFNLKGNNGLAPIVKVFTNAKGEFLYGQITPIIQLGAGIPYIDKQKRVIETIRKLSLRDFSDSPIQIDQNGKITYKKN